MTPVVTREYEGLSRAWPPTFTDDRRRMCAAKKYQEYDGVS